MKSGDWLKAGGVFLLSVGLATGLGFGLSSLSTTPECGFSVRLTVERHGDALEATVTHVDEVLNIADVAYQIVQLRGSSSKVIAAGNLTDALEGTDSVVYVPGDPAKGTLEPGDRLLVEMAQEDIHVLLVTREGTPLGWTAGCEDLG